MSIDLLPHPDMFTDATLGRSQEGANMRDDDGAKRVFFGGERFIEGISGEAYVMNTVPSINFIIFYFLLKLYVPWLMNCGYDFIYQITIQRTVLNSPLGLEVQLHITEAVCPALSEPGK